MPPDPAVPDTNTNTSTGTNPSPTRHPTYSLDSGSLAFTVEPHAYKVHGDLLAQHSPFFSRLQTGARDPDAQITIDPSRGVLGRDVEVLLAHIYDHTPITPNTLVPRLVSALRVSAPTQLDFPAVHATVKDTLGVVFGRVPLVNTEGDVEVDEDWLGLVEKDMEEAFLVATEYNIVPMLKTLYYALATSPSTPPPLIPPEAIITSNTLHGHLTAHFTPILYTPPAAAHMACTDALAGAWMARAIVPALSDGGGGRPLETLARWRGKGAGWVEEGVCVECVEEKRAEWAEEGRGVWELVNGWLGLG